MMNKDAVTNFILKLDVFMNKRGNDITARNDVIRAINNLTDEAALDTIYVNTMDNINLPDVAVIPLYNQDFSNFALNPDDPETCPFGYTIEINSRCFTEYTSEELAAVILHDIMQNVQSDTVKIRFMKAYNAAISKHPVEEILNTFMDISNSEITFMIYMQICCRPFKVPVGNGMNLTGTDDVLVALGLGDAYDSYLKKLYRTWMYNDHNADADPEDLINREIENDFRDANTVIMSCLDKDIRHYYTMIREGVPLVTLEHILGNPKTMGSLGFISRKRNFKHRYQKETPPIAQPMTTITESYMNPKNEVELRFKVDQIISEMRYAESEAEREVILFKIKNLTLKLTKTKLAIEKKMTKDPSNKAYSEQMRAVMNFLDELNMLREKVTKMEIKQKVWRVYSKTDLPEGYRW